jgi:hypothetical protein
MMKNVINDLTSKLVILKSLKDSRVFVFPILLIIYMKKVHRTSNFIVICMDETHITK